MDSVGVQSQMEFLYGKSWNSENIVSWRIKYPMLKFLSPLRFDMKYTNRVNFYTTQIKNL